jgi:FkbM family methyltransferase
MLSLDTNELQRWRNDNGDNTYNIKYPLTPNSIVIDLGGFTGIWAQQIIDLYNCHLYIIEPVEEFYLRMVTKFSHNNKVKLMNVGVSNENKESIIYLNSDSSSLNGSGIPIKAKFLTLEKIFEIWNINSVDLIQINIEGHEYDVLENIITSHILNKIKYIQIQFHKGIEKDSERRNFIREQLQSKGFKNRFNYAFVWECWEKYENRN